MTQSGFELDIDELVLRGLDPSDRAAIREAIERELARLCIARGVPPHLAGQGDGASAQPPPVRVRPGSRAQEIGAQVARSLYAGPRKA
jgi:hypothetical protein